MSGADDLITRIRHPGLVVLGLGPKVVASGMAVLLIQHFL